MGLTWSLNDSYGFIGDLIFCCGRTDRRICNKGVPRGPKKYKYDLLDKGSRQKNGLFTVRLNVRGGSPRLTVKILFFLRLPYAYRRFQIIPRRPFFPFHPYCVECETQRRQLLLLFFTSISYLSGFCLKSFAPAKMPNSGKNYAFQKTQRLQKCPLVAKITIFKRPKDFKKLSHTTNIHNIHNIHNISM